MVDNHSNLGETLGGKGAKLAALQKIGCNVPTWFGVEAAEFRAALDHPDIHAATQRSRDLLAADDVDGAANELSSAVQKLALPDALQQRLVKQWRDQGGGGVAVRSSAIGEDGTEHSFAGQFETVLGIRTEAALLDAVRTCWASAWTSRAVAYRHRHGMDPLDAAMGLVIQVQIDSDVSGVMFTADPVSGDPYVTVISGTWGLGEALVSGIANADTWRIDRRTNALDVDLADKDVQIVLNPEGLTEEVDVLEDRRNIACMNQAQVLELVNLGRKLESELGGAQDVEWAFADGELHVLQTRPVTSELRPRGIRRTWDNSNIVESYSGVVSPLTFSFAREAYTQVYLQAMLLLKLPASEQATARTVVRQMLGYVDGRVYYNLASWYYLLSVMPNYEENAEAMETMMGVRAGLDGRIAPRASAGRKLRITVTLLWLLATIKRRIVTFRGLVRSVLDKNDVDFHTLDADQLVDAYDELRTDLLGNWQVPIVNDFRVMVMFDRLQKTITRFGLDDTGTLRNDLMCGQGEVESAEPTYHLVRVAERVRADEVLSAVVLDTSDDQLRDAIRTADSESASWVDEQINEYLRRFGDRCANELKLETPTLHENPALLYSVLRNFVRQPDLTADGMQQREREIREVAERAVYAKIDSSGILSPLRRRAFNWSLRHARQAVRDREALRFDRTRVFGLARRMLSALGDRFAEADLLDTGRDVFMLEVEEIIGTVQGTSTTSDLRALVAIRAAEFERRLAGDELPDRIDTVGIAAANPLNDAYAAIDTSGDSLQGIGCCPGIVERTARVVLSPGAGVTLNGDIMVCTRTDPGWVPLFPSCGGLLVERGSLLSHSAIVAREFGIPAIVGVPGLMSWARDGEPLRMDGSTGRIERPDAVLDPDDDATSDETPNEVAVHQ